jgi:type IV pilus assembly protein PilE
MIELLITMAVLAILASIAVPAYNSYVLKSHRTDATTALLDLASMEERFFSTQNFYSATATDLGYTAFPVTVGSGYYQISAPTVTAAVAPTALAPAGTPAAFTITATPVGTQVNDSTCASFTISSTGAQTATPAANAATCWN